MQTADLFQPKVPSVSELTGQIKDLLETSFSQIDVEGELSQPNQSTNGHLYFTLKDSGAQLPCVMWRSSIQRLGFKPQHGQQVILTGDIQVYPPHGKYQMIVKLMKQAGLGALQLAFDRLKEKLKNEGLFDPSLKKKLPLFPKTVGVVTSSTGAALQDMISTLNQRYPLLTLKIYHASVQGVNAAPEIAQGITYFSERNDVDVLIIGRGGGSLEDLWPFNEEVVARAIFACPIPVISAVGHETDFSISDFVADVRAATPTQAISLLTPNINDLRYQVDDLQAYLKKTMTQRVQRAKERVQTLAGTYALKVVQEKVKMYKNRTEWATSKMISLNQNKIKDHKQKLNVTERKLPSLLQMIHLKKVRQFEQLHTRLRLKNPNEPLERGFSRVYQNGVWVKRKSDFKEKTAFILEWTDGKSKA